MAKTRMKGYLTSHVIKKIQFKTTMKYHYAPIRMAKIQDTDNSKCWQGCEATGNFINCWWECKMVQLLQKTVYCFL